VSVEGWKGVSQWEVKWKVVSLMFLRLASLLNQHHGQVFMWNSCFIIAIVWCQNASTVTCLCQHCKCLDIILQLWVVYLNADTAIVHSDACRLSQLLLCCLRGRVVARNYGNILLTSVHKQEYQYIWLWQQSKSHFNGPLECLLCLRRIDSNIVTHLQQKLLPCGRKLILSEHSF